jgi:cytoskeletal protein CcmA (bactofilin family)
MPTINTQAVSHVTTTVISAESTLWGNLSSDGNVELHGALKGSIHTKGNVVISGGRILGNITGSGIQLLNARVQGNIMATGRVAMDVDSEVMGDIKAENISVDGHVKGDLKIEKSTNLLANALLMGNVDTRIVSMSEGARVLGTIMVDQNNASAVVFSEVEI